MSVIQIPDASSKFSNLQLELLGLYSHNISDEALLVIKDMIGHYLADKSIDKLDDWALQNNIGDATLEKWLNEKS